MIHFANHAFKGLDDDLNGLRDSIGTMLLHVERQLEIFHTVLEGDLSGQDEAKQRDKQVNELEFSIERQVAQTLSKYQLIGDELRFVILTLKISASVERMGDKAKSCVKRAAKLSKSLPMETLTALQSLSNQALAMAHSSIKLIGELDEPAFIRLMAHEETIENLTQKLIDISQQHKGKEASQLLAITKNLERIGDLALDIGRSCHYIHTGQKYEKSEPLALTQ